MKKVWFLHVITFLAAFLLFQIELIITKIFLPHYGGSYLVWGACVVFFQAILLGGYVFAHFGMRWLGMSRYRLFHLFLVCLPLFFFPGKALEVSSSISGLALAPDVFLRLALTIGPVFFVLATISLVTQRWVSSSDLPERVNPYSLYAVSNIGSFGALLTYPFLVENYLDIAQQLSIWRGLYLFLIVLHCGAYFFIGMQSSEKEYLQKKCKPIEAVNIIKWLLASAGGVMMFLSVTNIITSEIAPMPLLWILPLGLYLLAFVLNFKKNCWCPEWITKNIHMVFGFSVLLYIFIGQRTFPIPFELIFLCGTLFILCMYCQNQLIRNKPKDDNQLTFFYVILSLGGFLGGIITTWIIPLISSSFVEYHVGLVVIAATMIVPFPEKRMRPESFRMCIYWLILILIWPLVFTKYNIWGIILLFFTSKWIFSSFEKSRQVVVIALVGALMVCSFGEKIWDTRSTTIFTKRNYYGIYQVKDFSKSRRLFHGTTLHGVQLLDPSEQSAPTTYYGKTSPLWNIMTKDMNDFKKIGAVGLGVGTIATYLYPFQTLDFYELDPDMLSIATKYFSFVNNSAGTINHIFGDARVSLEARPNVRYDLLIIDAFGGDAVPFHLLTKEALDLYKSRLTEKGVILFHISNRYVRLGPTLASTAYSLNAEVSYQKGVNGPLLGTASTWVAVTWNKKYFQKLVNVWGWSVATKEKASRIRPWTDQYTNILPLIKTEALISSIKYFKLFYW